MSRTRLLRHLLLLLLLSFEACVIFAMCRALALFESSRPGFVSGVLQHLLLQRSRPAGRASRGRRVPAAHRAHRARGDSRGFVN